MKNSDTVNQNAAMECQIQIVLWESSCATLHYGYLYDANSEQSFSIGSHFQKSKENLKKSRHSVRVVKFLKIFRLDEEKIEYFFAFLP